MELRVHRVPHSTNVERVALALAHKGLPVTWVDVDPGDRSAVRALSGQDLVPVLEAGDEVVADSTAILRWLDDRNWTVTRGFFDFAPAPLIPLIGAMARRNVRTALKGQGFGRHSRADIEALA